MRKFKHKTTGYIATETNSEKNYKVSEPKNFTIPKWIVENSEDWEEVKEQEFEILEFTSAITKLKHVLREDGKYNPNGLSKETLLEHSVLPLQITKIKRLLDNEDFSTEDKVSVYGNLNKWVIKSFEISDKEFIKVKVVDSYNWELRADIASIEKYKYPLFVTEDGVEVFEGDTVHWVNSNICNYLYSTKFSEFHPAILKGETIFKIFSTKEAAEKYIDENKPIYSKKQIKEAFENSFVRESYILDVPYCCADRFKEEIFKQKLNL